MRLTRVGSKKNPHYRVVVADSRSPRAIEFDEDKVKAWLDKGAQPSETVSRLLKAKNIGAAAPKA
jgi:small subunit ribosomal protein S16